MWRAALVVLAGCGRIGFDPYDRFLVTTALDRLAVPPGIASIDDLPAELDDLSLREALAIAANHPGPDRIEFDPDVFPATIALDSPLDVRGPDTTIDGTGRGVTVELAAGFDGTLFELGDRTRLVGLILHGGTAPRVDIDSASNVEVVGNDFTAPGSTAIRINNARDVVLRTGTFVDTTGTAIVLDRATGITIDGVFITGALGDPIAATDSSNLVIQDTTIVIAPTGGSGRGVVFTRVTRSQILDNLIDPGPARLISLEDSSNNEIVGNILDRGDVGIGLFGASNANLVLRNVIAANVSEAMYIAATAGGNRILHNTLYMTSEIVDGAADTELANNLEAAQGFVDPDTYDFRLAPGNPAIDAATDLGLDLLPDQPERFLGAAPDLGAVETL